MSDRIVVETPFGCVSTLWEDEEIAGVGLGDASRPGEGKVLAEVPAYAVDLVHRIHGYFAGAGDLLAGAAEIPEGTPFQMRVWEATAAIPYGETVSYGEVGVRIGVGPAGARAVGAALNQNPLPLIVPCHRVISAKGDLTGFAAGLAWKRALLGIEMAQISLAFQRNL